MADNHGTQLRNIVLNMLTASIENGSLSSVVLRDFYEKNWIFYEEDSSFVVSLYLGTMEKLVYIDFLINNFSKVKPEKMKPVIKNILRLSVYQIVFMENVPDRAALSEAQKLCEFRKLDGLKGFVNGVLRAVQRDYKTVQMPEYIENYFSKWLYELILEQYEKAVAEKYFEAVNRYDNSLTVRLHAAVSKDEIIESLKKEECNVQQVEGVEKCLKISGFSSLTKLEAFCNGWISVQDVSSMMPAFAAAKEKEKVKVIIDVCAAPGGKSMLFADEFSDGEIISMDVSEEKTKLIRENIKRMGYSNIKVTVNDARCAKEEFLEKADIVLCDVPCSGLGVIGKKPDIKNRIQPEDFEELIVLQQDILKESSRYVKKGGLLIYSTCTINKDENEENAKRFVKENPDFSFEPLDHTMPEELLGKEQVEGLKEGMLQLIPGINDMDGFFLAAMRKSK